MDDELQGLVEQASLSVEKALDSLEMDEVAELAAHAGLLDFEQIGAGHPAIEAESVGRIIAGAAQLVFLTWINERSKDA